MSYVLCKCVYGRSMLNDADVTLDHMDRDLYSYLLLLPKPLLREVVGHGTPGPRLPCPWSIYLRCRTSSALTISQIPRILGKIWSRDFGNIGFSSLCSAERGRRSIEYSSGAESHPERIQVETGHLPFGDSGELEVPSPRLRGRPPVRRRQDEYICKDARMLRGTPWDGI